MKLIKHFDAFLENVVNLNQHRMELIDTRTTAIVNFLKKDEVFGPLFKASIPQGSFAQKTIIKPKVDGTFDVDLLIHLDPMPDWDACEYVGKLYTALGRSPVYKTMRHRRTRCVYIDYADEFHVDLVPYVEQNDTGYITNYKDNCFHLTDPKGFTGWLKDQNRTANGNLIKVIRLLKYVRDVRDERKHLNVKSVVLTTLIGERVSALKPITDPGCYADVPATLRTVVTDLNAYLQANALLPSIPDPGGSGDDLRDRWDQDSYTASRNRFNTLAAKIEEAYTAEGSDASFDAWQAVFGDSFKAPPKTAGKGALVKVGNVLRPVTERFLDLDFGIPFQTAAYSVQLAGRVKPKPGFRHGPMPSNGRVEVGRDIVFEIQSCTVPGNYDVYWKVRNTGPEAQAAGGLRGEIRKGMNTLPESTKWRGSHYVECYIVKHGRCLAKARHPVVIV